MSVLKTIKISSSLLLLVSSLYIIVFDNISFWSKFTDVNTGPLVDRVLVSLAFSSLFIFFLYILMSLLSFKKTTRYTVISFLISASIIGYFMDAYGTVISFSMIQNLLQTDINEAIDLLSTDLFIHVFIFGIVPSILVFYIPIKEQSVKNEFKARMLVFFLLLMVSSSSVYTKLKDVAFIGREHRDLRLYINPIFPVVSAYKYIKSTLKDKPSPLEKVFDDSIVDSRVAENGKHTVLVIVVGETARASNFKLNGYSKNTNPRLSSLDVINYSNASSCGTATADSLPCMFSDISHDQFDLDKIHHRENLLDALSYANIDVLWRENNSGCKGVCNRSETQVMHVRSRSEMCHGDECYDEVLLENLKFKIDNLTHNSVIFLHQQGSHGPAYYKRVPDEFTKFKPVCTSKALQNCSNEQITNSYDNTILYTDYVLSEVISILKSSSDKANTAMIYMSDHGESLGEGGVYLHGLPYFMAPDEQTKIPFIMWLSANIKKSKGISGACLSSNSAKPYSHDNLIHSVLGLMNIETKMYNDSLDVFSFCRSTESRLATVPFSTRDFNKT